MGSLKERLALYERAARGGRADDTADAPIETPSDAPGEAPGEARRQVKSEAKPLVGLVEDGAGVPDAVVRSKSEDTGPVASQRQRPRSLQERMRNVAAGSDPSAGGAGFATASIGATIAAASKGFQASSAQDGGKISVKSVAAEADKVKIDKPMPKYEDFAYRKASGAFEPGDTAGLPPSAEEGHVREASKGVATAQLGHQIASQVARKDPGERISVKAVVGAMERSAPRSPPEPPAQEDSSPSRGWDKPKPEPTPKSSPMAKDEDQGTQNVKESKEACEKEDADADQDVQTLKRSVEACKEENAELAEKIKELEAAIAVETAKSLETDEWVLKLTRECEALQKQMQS